MTKISFLDPPFLITCTLPASRQKLAPLRSFPLLPADTTLAACHIHLLPGASGSAHKNGLHTIFPRRTAHVTDYCSRLIFCFLVSSSASHSLSWLSSTKTVWSWCRGRDFTIVQLFCLGSEATKQRRMGEIEASDLRFLGLTVL